MRLERLSNIKRDAVEILWPGVRVIVLRDALPEVNEIGARCLEQGVGFVRVRVILPDIE